MGTREDGTPIEWPTKEKQNDAWEKQTAMLDEAIKHGAIITKHMAIQNATSLIVTEYFQDKEAFGEKPALVQELQNNLEFLDYGLGNSGKNKDGVDGQMGPKTITEIGNFILDYPKDIEQLSNSMNAIQNATSKER